MATNCRLTIGIVTQRAKGAKGPRLYDWARVLLLWLADPQWRHWLLIRRSRKKPGELAYCIVFATAETTLAELAAVAGLMWTATTRAQHKRDGLRFASDVSDAEWALIEPLLPSRSLVGRPPGEAVGR